VCTTPDLPQKTRKDFAGCHGKHLAANCCCRLCKEVRRPLLMTREVGNRQVGWQCAPDPDHPGPGGRHKLLPKGILFSTHRGPEVTTGRSMALRRLRSRNLLRTFICALRDGHPTYPPSSLITLSIRSLSLSFGSS
jgi:hypothetical protein